MIFRREMRVPRPRDSKRLRLIKVALLAFVMTPKVALLAFVVAPIVYFFQKPPLTRPETPKTESIDARLDATQIIQRQGQASEVTPITPDTAMINTTVPPFPP
jgi:hypothetical protein